MAVTLERALVENPFLVLGVPPDCSRADFEREGQKLLSMLALGLVEAASYATPLGPRPRTSELVREAMAELRDPQRRVLHELLAPEPSGSTAALAFEPPRKSPETWTEALWAFGFAPKGTRWTHSA